MRYEHLRVLIEDDNLWSIFAQMCQAFARAEVPPTVMAAIRIRRMTALKKDNGRIRGIVAGNILRRLVGKTVAHQHAVDFLKCTAPYQYALQTKAGVEALAHVLRYLAENDPDIVVMSLDGIGAFDHVKRAAFIRNILDTPELQDILPLVLALYGSESKFLWTDDDGNVHEIIQAESGEQGCRLMPTLYALAQQHAIVFADQNLLPDELLLNFLDDL